MKNLFIIFSIFIYSSCNHSGQKNIASLSAYEEDPGVRNDRRFSEAMSNLTKKLNLRDLKNGTDSFEVRIWCPVTSEIQSLITIRYIESDWHISETYVWLSYPEKVYKRNDTVNHLLEVVVDSTKSRTLIPLNKSKFTDSLLNTFIRVFPSKRELEGSYEIAYDSYRYIFEIAGKQSYEILDYNCGGEISGKESLHDIIRNLITFLRKELSLKIRDCN